MVEELKPRILVFGVGGAGGNAVDNMIEANLQGVEFIAANTDAQALERSRTENRIQLGPQTTKGLGAGARPDVGREAAEESIDEIRACLEDANMLFIAAGMGGGTGTGAAPVIARIAREMGILSVAVVTKPFTFEGTRRMDFAEDGLECIAEFVDTMIVVPNQNLFRIANDRTTFADAFRMADDVLYSGVRGITDLMVLPGLINLDFADVEAIMRNMGTAIMGMGEAEGENRAQEAARQAIDNPLLDDVTVKGAKGVVINITGGYDMTLFEVDEAANEVRREIDENANIILGSAFEPALEGKIRVSVVAAGVGPATPVAAETPPVAETIRQPIAEPVSQDTDVSDPEPIDAQTADVDVPVVIKSSTRMAEASEVEEAEADTPAPVDLFHEQEDPKEADHVPASSVFTPRTEDPVADEPLNDNASAGFSSLFGWRRSTPDESPSDPGDAGVPTQIVSSPEDHPEAAPFDDEDLEIPAFLRRSANH